MGSADCDWTGPKLDSLESTSLPPPQVEGSAEPEEERHAAAEPHPWAGCWGTFTRHLHLPLDFACSSTLSCA